MSQHRVLIVGGGPGGSSLALSLLAEGVDPASILLVDKARFPRPKLCGGGITRRGTELLATFLPELEKHLREGATPPLALRTVGLDFVSQAGRFPVTENGAQWLYDRAELDHLLLTRVKEAGVAVWEETRLAAMHRGAAGYEVTLRTPSGERQCTTDWLVGADGARSLVRRLAGLRGGRLGRLVEAYYAPKEGTHPDPDRLLFDFDPILEGIPGYAWIFPYTRDGLYKIGVMDGRGVCTGAQLRAYTDRFATHYGYRRVDEKIAGWPEHYFTPRSRASAPHLLLVGEAWGVDPLLGEGIAPSFEIARYAASRLAEALRRNEKVIRGYESGFRRTEPGRNLMFQHYLANLLYGPAPHRWLRVLFGHQYMREMAAQGTESYGRLARHIPLLSWSYAMQCFRDGLPSAGPFHIDHLDFRGRHSRPARALPPSTS